MAVSQTILCTTVPNGFDVVDNVFQLSLVFSPRLRSPGDTTLADFPDWLDWPATVAGMTFEVEFPGLGLTLPATVASSPDSARWAALFPSNTLVRGFGFDGLDHRRLFSYPTRSILGFLADRWGRFGGTDYDDHILYDDLAADDGFDPIGFEQLGDLKETGPSRKSRLLGQIEQAFDPTSNDPTKWALQPASNPLATVDGTALELLKWERYHRRGRSDRNDALTPVTPTLYDFHEIGALAGDFFHLPRMLGLVLDLTFASTRALFGAGSPDTQVRVLPSWTPVLANPPDPDSAPYTRCHIGGGDSTNPPAFVANPKNPATTDYIDRWLNLGDSTKFDVFDVDVDGGASRSRGFADNVSRSRRNGNQKYSAATPDRYSLPHHSSAGLQVSRFDRATQSTTQFAGHLVLNSQLVDANGDPNPGTPPDLFLDDLVRGYRFDVKHQELYLSLMRRVGQYHFLSQGGAGDVDIEEEGVVSDGVTSAGGTDGDPKDIYQGETLVRWKGWSLANHLIGKAIGPDDQPSDGVEDQSNAPFLSTFTVPPGTLPRLRFGDRYQLRGRAVDLAGNSPAPEDTEPAGAASPVVIYRRYEPVTSPVVVYRDVPAAPDDPGLHHGDTAEILVIRSENAASLDSAAGASRRHLLPPKVAQSFAELHGVLDTGAGGAMDKTVYDHVAELDAGDLANHPDGVDDPTTPGSKAFPVDHLALNYLPDPLARAAVLRDLPPGGSPATANTLMPMQETWPDYDTWRIDLVGGPASRWDIDITSRVLTVTLAKADVFEPRLSSALESTDLIMMGVWAWIAAANSPVPSALLRAAQTGSHWMLTPWRQMSLIHAVRTPLADPDLPEGSFSAVKQHAGETFAVLQRQLIFHRKSTGLVDILAKWQMKIDTGPGGADPTVETPFQGVAGSLTLDRAKADPVVPGEELFVIKHEFGDTKYRSVDYWPVATSAFVELYRESTSVTPTGTDPVVVDGRGIEPPTVKVSDQLTDLEFTQARAGQPATGDYIVDQSLGTIARTPLSTMADGQPVDVSYVAEDVHTHGPFRTRSIKSSARPAAPKVKWALPTFSWHGSGSSGDPHTKQGGSVRLYLERPWWSSGDGEQLAVVCWPLPLGQPGQMPKDYEPYATQWGTDPVHLSTDAVGYPRPINFTLASGWPTLPADLPFPEVANQPVSIAPHDVAFDAERDLWYCDIAVDLGEGAISYNPFIRLAVARYQVNSLTGLALSPVVMADFVQLASDRGAVDGDVRAQRPLCDAGWSHIGGFGRRRTQHRALPGRDPARRDHRSRSRLEHLHRDHPTRSPGDAGQDRLAHHRRQRSRVLDHRPDRAELGEVPHHRRGARDLLRRLHRQRRASGPSSPRAPASCTSTRSRSPPLRPDRPQTTRAVSPRPTTRTSSWSPPASSTSSKPATRQSRKSSGDETAPVSTFTPTPHVSP